ncbi:MAG: LysM peptidoglycan-binding domain-containing protein [Acidimicrobiales bacterium]
MAAIAFTAPRAPAGAGTLRRTRPRPTVRPLPPAQPASAPCPTVRPLPAPRPRPAPRPPPAAVYRRRRAVVALALAATIVIALASLGALGGGPATTQGARAVASTPVGASVYVVRPGDTLWGIASRLDPSGDPRPLVDRLAAQLHGDVLQPGQRLLLSG